MREFLSGWFLLLIARFVLGMVFVVAAVPKIANPDVFAASIEAYELLPTAPVNAAAIVIPWIELICGLFLIAGTRTRAAAAILGGLLVFFIVAISVAVLRGLNIDCGCFGGSDGSPVGWGKVLEDVGLLVLVWLLVRDTGETAATPDVSAGNAASSAPRTP